MTISIESRAQMATAFERRPLTKILRDKAITSRIGRSIVRRAVPWALESGTESFFEYSGKENIRKLKPFVSDGRMVVIAASHESQGDSAATVRVARDVRDEFPEEIDGFDYLMAKTMGNGKQGKPLEVILNEAVYPWMEKHNVYPLETISDNDVSRRQEKKDFGQMREATSRVKDLRRWKIIHPQATMDAGRKVNSQTEERKGMGGMSDSSKDFFKLLQRFKIKYAVLPVGIHGYFEFFDPDSRNFTAEGLEMLSNRFLRLGYLASERVGSIRIGEPVPMERFLELEDPYEAIMKEIAKQMPRHARGKYR